MIGIVISGCISDSTKIVSGTIPIGAGEYSYYKISVPTMQATVYGDFTASVYGNTGNADGNDIIVIIIDDASYKNWSEGKTVSTYPTNGSGYYLDSKQTTSGSFTVDLPMGNYYLIYSNKYAAYNKTIKTNVGISYNKQKSRLIPLVIV